MQLHPVIAALRCHKLTVLLLTLQVAFTCAIVCNIAFMMVNRINRISMSTGIAERDLSVIHSEDVVKDHNNQAQHVTDLAILRTLPYVESVAAVTHSLPLNGNDDSYGVCPNAQALARAEQMKSLKGGGCLQPSVFDGTPGLIRTLGLNLLEGRDFLPDEYVSNDAPSVAIITRSLAQHLYPGQNALGKAIYTGSGNPIRIVGIVEELLRPSPREPSTNYDGLLWPQFPSAPEVTYILRSEQQNRRRVLKEAQSALIAVNPYRVIDPDGVRTYEEIRARYFQRDTTMLGLLIAAAFGLLIVTALGIAGLANFWVQQRTHTIGIRRALGATPRDILRYFQAENFIIVTFGIVFGVVAAFAINLTLMKFYELSHLPVLYPPIGAAVLWLLGQLSVLAPALRAARVAPVAATRMM